MAQKSRVIRRKVYNFTGSEDFIDFNRKAMNWYVVIPGLFSEQSAIFK